VSRVFDADNRQLSEVDAAQLYNGAARTDTYGYNADGTLKQIVTTNVQTGSTRSFAYEWWDTARQTELKVKVNGVENWADGTSKLTYDVNGNLYRATDVAGKRTIQYVSDGDGQILYRQELVARTDVSSDWNASTNEVVAGSVERRRNYYYLNGQRIGDVNNDNGMPSLTDYAVALAQAKSVSNDERNKKFTPTAYANFDENYQPINDAYPGTSPTTYTVGTGDTLSSIAARVWGDRAMWYLIADANGLSGVETLSAGMRLVIPNKVTNIHNNAGTLRVYDAGEAIGDVSPTLPPPPPPPHKDCGGLGTIVMIAIAAAVTIYTAGAAAGALSVATGETTMMGAGVAVLSGGAGFGAAALGAAAVGGAAGSIVSQGFAMATGLQDGFSWKAVGQSALGSAITAGIGGLANQPGSVLSALKEPTTWASAGRAALSAGASQALQGDWNWRNVMASAVGAGVGVRVGASLQGSVIGRTLGSEGSRIAGGMVGGIAGVWAAQGNRAQYSAVLASTLGNALGESLAGSMQDGVDWNQAPDESAAESARLGRSGNAYAYWPDQTAAESALLARQGDPYAYWPDRTAAESARLGRYEIKAQFLERAASVWAAQDAASASAALTQQHAAADAYRRELLQKDETASRLSGGSRAGTGVAHDDATVWNMRDASAALRGRATESNFSYGFNLGDRSVLDGVPITTEERVGRALGEAWTGVKSAVYAMTGAQSFDLAVADWRAGNYRFAALHGMQSLGEAGLTLMSLGVGSVRASAAVMQFPGVEATIGARATYIGNTSGAAEIGVPATRSANPLSPVLEYDAYGNEIYYRAMKESHYKTLVEDGLLMGTGETSLAPLEAYSAGYDGALVRLTVKPGTSAQLQDIGIAANQPAAAEFPGMSTRTGPWNQMNARFKVEATGAMNINDGLGIMNTQLGKGSALDIFNAKLLDFERLN
jgi:hypothetical protein